jgi:hypothetical protein
MKTKTIISTAILLIGNFANAQSITCDPKALGSINYDVCQLGQIGPVGGGTTNNIPVVTNPVNTPKMPLSGQVSGQVPNAVVMGSTQPVRNIAGLINQVRAASVTSGTMMIGGSTATASTGIAGGVQLPPGTTQAAAVQAYRAAGSAQSDDLAAMSPADYASWVARGGLNNVSSDQSSLYVGMKGYTATTTGYTPTTILGGSMTGGTVGTGSTGIAGGVQLPAGTTQAAAVQAYSAAGSAQTSDLAAMSAADYSSWVARGGLSNVPSDQSSLYDGMARNR